MEHEVCVAVLPAVERSLSRRSRLCVSPACRASVGFMAQLLPEDRKALGVYPVLLFYLAIAWMILVQ